MSTLSRVVAVIAVLWISLLGVGCGGDEEADDATETTDESEGIVDDAAEGLRGIRGRLEATDDVGLDNLED